MKQLDLPGYQGPDRRHHSFLNGAAPWVAIALTVVAGAVGYGSLRQEVSAHSSELDRQRVAAEQVPVLVVEIRGLRGDIARLEGAIARMPAP